jgi:hypothetical protein
MKCFICEKQLTKKDDYAFEGKAICCKCAEREKTRTKQYFEI